MAVVVTSQLTTIDACEDATPSGWTAHNISGAMGVLASITASSEEQAPFAGTYSYAYDIDIENGGYVKAVSGDYSSKIIYIAGVIWTGIEVLAPGGGSQSGVYIIAGDSSGNWGYWHVAGSDTYKGGWRVFVADLSRAPDTNSGTAPNLANCTSIGLGWNSLSKSKATHNAFFDLLREADSGDGLKVTTTSSSVATLADLVAGDGTELITYERGLYFTKVPLIFGDTTSGDMEFAETGEILVFEDVDVPAGHYGITVEGNSAGTIEFQLGTKSGTRGISGLTILGNKPYHLTATDTDIDALKLYGTTFKNYSDMAFPVTATGREVIDCTFVGGGEVTVSTCPFTYCSWIDADDGGTASGAVLITSTSHQVQYCSFINCPDAWHMTTTGTYPCVGNQFSGNTYDVENSGNSAAIIIEATATSNINTHHETGSPPGTTTVSNPVSLIIDIVDANGAAITATCEVTVVRNSDTVELYHAEDVTTGTTTYNFTSGSGTVTYINVVNVTGYEPKTVNNFTLPSADATVTIQLDADRYFSNP